jgi:hypothetical protein
MKKVILFLLIAGLIAGCYYDNEEYLYPKVDKGCDTTGVTFSKSILPILQTNCYNCHGARENANLGKGINLEDFNILKQRIGTGEFYSSVVQDNTVLPMPQNGAKLDTCAIRKIKIWIDKGALDN